jgi:adenylate kinase family enzyme
LDNKSRKDRQSEKHYDYRLRKSTLSRKLGQILNIEVFHLDSLHWKPGWVETPFDEWKRIVEKLTSNEKWIIDGNYGDSTLETRFQAADTIIFLDMPRTVCVWRILKRRLKYIGKTRPDMGKGCPEKFDFKFIKWIWNYPKTKRPLILQQISKYSADKKVIVLRRRKEVNEFIEKVMNKQQC